MMWKIQQAMQDDAIRTARIHPAVHPGNRDEVFIWQNFQPAYRDLGNRASPVNRAHMKRPLVLLTKTNSTVLPPEMPPDSAVIRSILTAVKRVQRGRAKMTGIVVK